MSVLAYIFVFGLMGCLMLSVVYGLYWAVRRGQFSNFARGATSIFDEEEPQGFRTDAFPGESAKERKTP